MVFIKERKMKRIAKFSKVSYERYECDYIDTYGSKEGAKEVYEQIKLPLRATKGSAGYDFFAPRAFTLAPGETIKIPTGIRVRIDEGWVLKIYPRSGLGFKYRVQLNNTVGIIDSDYYYSTNEGHIFVKMTNAGDKTLSLQAGDGFSQGIFIEYGITEDDDVDTVRDGGFGSTSAKK